MALGDEPLEVRGILPGIAEDSCEEVQPREVQRLQDAYNRQAHAQGSLHREVDLPRGRHALRDQGPAVTPRATWKLLMMKFSWNRSRTTGTCPSDLSSRTEDSTVPVVVRGPATTSTRGMIGAGKK